MVFAFLTCFIVTIRSVARSSRLSNYLTSIRLPYPTILQFGAALFLPVAFWLQTRIAIFQTSHDGERDAWFLTLPIPVVDEALPFSATSHQAISAAALVCTGIMTIALIATCWTPIQTNGMRVAIAFSGCAVAVLAITAPVLTSTDAYYYVFAAAAGRDAYNPSPSTFTAADIAMTRFIPLRDLNYGPIWLSINWCIASLGHTVAQKIVSLRLFNAFLMVLCAYVLRVLKQPVRAQLAFILNPMLWFQFVLNCHNDLIGLTACLGAMLLSAYTTVAAIILVAVAGCIKLPFLIFGLPAFLNVTNRAKAFLGMASAITLSLVLSWVLGGVAYFQDLVGYLHSRRVGVDAAGASFAMLAATVSLLIMILAILRRRYVDGGGLLAPYLSPLPFPWYLVWGLPYAVAQRSGLTAMLFAMPLVAILLDGTYSLRGPGQAIFTVVAVALVLDAVHERIGKHYNRA